MTEQASALTPTASGYLVVLVTCPLDEAERIAATLVGERLCACINILGNIRSVYRWQGEVKYDEESLLVMKTMGHIYDRLEARIREIHPYEVPEIICLNIEQGADNYLNWLCQSVQQG